MRSPLTRRGAARLEEIRERLAFVDGRSLPIVAGREGRVHLWHCAGGLASASLALTRPGLDNTQWDDFSLSLQATSTATVARAVADIDPADACPPLPDDMAAALKFSDCLPNSIASAVLRARTAVPDAVAGILLRHIRRVQS